MKGLITTFLCALPLGACSLTTMCSISFDKPPESVPPLLPAASQPLAAPACQTVTAQDGKLARLCQEGDYVEIEPLSGA